MNCPVCNHQELNQLAVRCTACESDLSVLYKISEIEEKYVDSAKHRTELEGNLTALKVDAKKSVGKWRRQAFRLLALFLFLPLIYKYCFSKENELTNAQTTLATQQLVAAQDTIKQQQIAQMKSQIADLQQDNESLQATKLRKMKYTLKKGETLAMLGERFFGNTKAGYRIAKDNKITAFDYTELPEGMEILIIFR